jgi:MFS family permease
VAGPAIWHRAWFPQGLKPGETRLLRLHLGSALLTGIVNGVFNLADVTLAKTLGASPLQVTALTVLTGLAYLGALFLGGAMHGRRKAPFILLCGLFGRLGLWLLAAHSDPRWFVLVIALSSLTQGVVYSAQVSIIKRAYREEIRPSLFGVSVSVTTLFQLIVSVAFGWLMDWNEHAYPIYFGIAGSAGFAGAWLLAAMEREIDRDRGRAPARDGATGEQLEPPSPPLLEAYRPLSLPSPGSTLRSIRGSVALVARILRRDREFRRYETNFFLYGVSILAIGPVVPLFLVRDLGMDYAQIGVAKGLLGQAGMILLTPMMGPALYRIGPVRFSARAFALLSLHPLLLAAAGLAGAGARLPIVFLSFAGLGVAMAAVNLVWSLSGIYFAREADPSGYQSAHTALTGVRGGIAPLLGYGVMQAGSKVLAFFLSGALFLVAAGLMARMGRGEPRAGGAT